MKLSDLIRAKNSLVDVATAIPAIPATTGQVERRTVARIATIAVANPGDEKTGVPATDEDAHRLWNIVEADGTRWLSSFCPPQALWQVQERYPGALSIEPCPSATQAAGGALSAKETALVASALDSLGEDDPDIRREVLDKCATDPACLRFWIARNGARWHGLYRRWLEGITEHLALVTLDDAQVREAIAAGMISRDTARESVLILIRAPAGDSGPGSVGLMAIPREKYRDFSPMAAVEALGEVH